jgi:hypothetical protein
MREPLPAVSAVPSQAMRHNAEMHERCRQALEVGLRLPAMRGWGPSFYSVCCERVKDEEHLLYEQIRHFSLHGPAKCKGRIASFNYLPVGR